MSSKPANPGSATSRIFAVGRTPKSGDRGAAVTSERIASDLAEFHASGGHIEVLGTTRLLTRIGDAGATGIAPATAPVEADATPPPQRRRNA
jgi:hypothetical protein